MNQDTPNELFATSAAAAYCKRNGRTASFSLLTKLRTKGADDPGDHGPAWTRDPVTNRVWYRRVDLDTWIAEWHSRLVKVSAPRPANFQHQAA